MNSRYYITYENISTAITVIDAPAGASILAVLRDSAGNTIDSATASFGVSLPPQSAGRYALEVYIILNGSLTSILQGILEVKSALPDSDTLGVVIKIDSTTLATILVTVALLGSAEGEYLPAQSNPDGSYTVGNSVTFGSSSYYASLNDGVITCFGIEAGEPTQAKLSVSGLVYSGVYGAAEYTPSYARITRPDGYVPTDSDLLTRAEIIALINDLK